MRNFRRRDFIFVLAGGVAASALSPAPTFAQGLKRKKNVLFVAVDDLRPQLNCYGRTQIISPNIDRLAREGLLFERAYCQQAICSPSRISLLTGLRPDSTTIYGLTKKVKDVLPNQTTLPQLFKNNGYETISIGKIYHHVDDDPKGWSKKAYRAKGDWKGRGYLTDEALEKLAQNEAISPSKEDRGPAFEAGDVPDNAYPDGIDADLAIREINRLKDKPFFLALGFHKPHLPFCAPKKYWDMYKLGDIELADNPFAPKGATEYTMSNFGELRNYYGMPQGKDRVPDMDARQLVHGYYACVTYIDALLGRVLNELDRLRLRDNTVVILWGDHGWKLGDHGSWCKHTNFHIDTRVPLIISAQGMKASGRSTSAFVEFVDIYPTLAELCDLDGVPDNLEGLSFMPLLDNPGRSWKKAAFSQYPRSRDDENRIVIGYSMNTERYNYVEWKHIKTREIRARELYDHQKDPKENVNVFDDPEYAKTLKTLEKMMQAGWKAALPE
jgi:arylsulfatase A-like enzyme